MRPGTRQKKRYKHMRPPGLFIIISLPLKSKLICFTAIQAHIYIFNNCGISSPAFALCMLRVSQIKSECFPPLNCEAGGRVLMWYVVSNYCQHAYGVPEYIPRHLQEHYPQQNYLRRKLAVLYNTLSLNNNYQDHFYGCEIKRKYKIVHSRRNRYYIILLYYQVLVAWVLII